MDKKQVLYRSSDLYFSSFLCALDVPLETTETEQGTDNKKVIFVFQLAEQDLPRFKSLYFGGGGTVKARKFVDAIRSLKSLCHC